MKIKNKVFLCILFSFIFSEKVSLDFGYVSEILKKDNVFNSSGLILDREYDFRGDEYISIKYTFELEDGWYIYSIKEKFAPAQFPMEGGDIYYAGHTIFESYNEYEDVIDEDYYKVLESALVEGFDNTTYPPKEIFYHKNKALFVQNIKLLDDLKSGDYSFISSFSGQVCNQVCIPLNNIETEINITIEEGKPRNRFILNGDETLFDHREPETDTIYKNIMNYFRK